MILKKVLFLLMAIVISSQFNLFAYANTSVVTISDNISKGRNIESGSLTTNLDILHQEKYLYPANECISQEIQIQNSSTTEIFLQIELEQYLELKTGEFRGISEYEPINTSFLFQEENVYKLDENGNLSFALFALYHANGDRYDNNFYMYLSRDTSIDFAFETLSNEIISKEYRGAKIKTRFNVLATQVDITAINEFIGIYLYNSNSYLDFPCSEDGELNYFSLFQNDFDGQGEIARQIISSFILHN